MIHCQHPFRFIKATIDRLGIHHSYKWPLVAYQITSPYIHERYSNRQILAGFIRRTTNRVYLDDIIGDNVRNEIGVSFKGDGHGYCLAGLDFKGRYDLADLINESCRIFGKRSNESIAIYDTGNSYHAYLGSVVLSERYSSIMTEAHRSSMVDHRWVQVGWTNAHLHTLRLSSNNKGFITQIYEG